MRIHVPAPCQQLWEDMLPVSGGRHCLHCRKDVIDFSAYSDEQLIGFFSKPRKHVCGRFQQQQLEKDIPVIVERRTVPLWLKAPLVMALLGISMPAAAQVVRPVPYETGIGRKKSTLMGDTILISVLKGRVLDEKGIGVEGAAVKLGGTLAGTVTDTSGQFVLHFPAPEDPSGRPLIVSHIGYMDTTLLLGDGTRELQITLPEGNKMFLGDVIVVGAPKRKRSFFKRVFPWWK